MTQIVFPLAAILAFAINMATATAAETQPIPPETPEEVVSTPPEITDSISGTITDTVIGKPLPSTDSPWTWVGLYRLESWGKTMVGATDCSTGQGCVNAKGSFVFNGKFPVARYEIVASTSGCLLTRHQFNYTGGNYYAEIAMPPQPVFVWFDEVSTSTDAVKFSLRVEKNSADPEPIVKFRTRVTVAGEPNGGWYTLFQLPRTPIGWVNNRHQDLVIEDEIKVSPNVLSGSTICLTAYVETNDPFMQYAQAGYCFVKP